MSSQEDPNITTKDLIAIFLVEVVTPCLSQEEFTKMLAIKVIDILVEDDK